MAEPLSITYTNVAEIEPHPENANIGNVEAIVESIRTNGYYAPIIVQASTGYILAGNHRYKAMLELHMAEVPVVFMDVDDEQAKRIMIADNRTTRLGHDDPEALLAILEELGESDIGLIGTGYTASDVDRLIATLDTDDLDLLTEGEARADVAATFTMFQTEPISGPGGTCSGILITRTDREDLSVDDYNAVRHALNLGKMQRGGGNTMGIPAWE